MLDTETITALEKWRSGTGVGASSQAIADYLSGKDSRGDYPHDRDDFDRCEGLLIAVPALRALLPNMANLNAYWAALVPIWDDLANSTSDDCAALLKSTLNPIEDADPSHARMSDVASIRMGSKINFKGPALLDQGDPAINAAVEAAARPNRDPMKPDADFKKHNQHAYNVTADELRQFIERIEHLDAENRDLAEQAKEVMAEAKGRTGQFAPGNVSHNKGRKGSCAPGCEKGWFKQGVRGGIAAKLYKPIGTERVTIDGYVEHKVNDDLPLKNRWAAVHRINWQAAHGPIPAGHRLKCLDGDKSNTTPDNWACIPIAMGPRLNGKHGRGYDTAPAELKPTIMVTTRLEHLARTIKKEAANG
jgi:hypothetical protein